MRLVYLLAFFLFIIFSCKSEKQTKEEQSPLANEVKEITIPADADSLASGLIFIDIVQGDGKQPQAGDSVAVHYTGRLMSGKKFDSSLDRNEPLSFIAGVGQMIPGFDEGLMSMRVGGKRKLFIPSELAYGEQGIPGVIPPNSMIVFEAELLEIK